MPSGMLEVALDNLPEDALSPRTFLPVSTSLVRALDMLPLPDHAESAVSRLPARVLPRSLGAEPILRVGASSVREYQQVKLGFRQG